MLWQQIFTIHKVPLQLRILDIEHIVVELFKFGIGHSMGVQLKVVSQHNFKLFCSNVTATIDNLLAVGIDVLRLSTVCVSMLAEDLRDFMPWLVIDLALSSWVGVVVPLWHLCVAEINLDLGALGCNLILDDLLEMLRGGTRRL